MTLKEARERAEHIRHYNRSLSAREDARAVVALDDRITELEAELELKQDRLNDFSGLYD